MTGWLKPYPKYKDSGIAWLGEVPAHWEVRRTKHLALVNPSKHEACSILKSDEMVAFLPMSCVGIDGRVDASMRVRVSEVWNGFTYFRKGDVLIAKITPCFENGKGACLDGLPTSIGFGSTEFVVLRPLRKVLPKFLYRTTLLDGFRTLGAMNMIGAAGQQRVSIDFIKNFPVAVPPLAEQEAIVHYLDYVDRRIRRYIRSRQKLISLLNEQKQAIINQVVTRGLDPNVRLKPSGVEWLGDVPEYWQMHKLKFLVSFVGGGTPSKANPSYWDGNIPWVSPKDMKTNVIVDTEDHISDEALRESTVSLVEPGAVLIVVRSGILRRKIPVAVNRMSVTLNQDMKALRPKGALRSEYLLAVIQGCEKSLLQEWTKQGATVESIEHSLMANSRLPVPPLEEQEMIIRYLTDATGVYDRAIESVLSEGALLREYQTRLISDVVTGKLDVREVAAKLPDESEDGSDWSEEAEDDMKVAETEWTAEIPEDDSELEGIGPARVR